MTRDEINDDILSIAKKHDRITLAWGTSVGKSKAAIDIVNRILEEHPDYKILLLVNEVAHKKNWKEQFETWNLRQCDMTIECYASLKNYAKTSWDILIADESHHLGSENRLLILDTMKTKHFLCLSATMPRDVQDNLNSIFGNFYIHKVSLQDSISYGILPEPQIQVIKLHLDTVKYDEEIVESWGTAAKRKVFKCYYKDRFKYKNRNLFPDAELHIVCTQQQKYDYLTDQYEYWRQRYITSRLAFAKNKWLHLGSDRKRFLGECKTAAAQEVIRRVGEDTRFLCFCTSIQQAEDLGGSDAIHSKKSESQKIIEAFNRGERDRMFAINMLQEGMNLKDLDWGMIIQLDGCDRGWIQKIGRMMRSEKPRVVILYYDNTKDIEYLRNVTEGIDNSYIKFYSLTM